MYKIINPNFLYLFCNMIKIATCIFSQVVFYSYIFTFHEKYLCLWTPRIAKYSSIQFINDENCVMLGASGICIVIQHVNNVKMPIIKNEWWTMKNIHVCNKGTAKRSNKLREGMIKIHSLNITCMRWSRTVKRDQMYQKARWTLLVLILRRPYFITS